tara:strand:- start:513 stop:1220 length:708 start_codon:yes stop_codon:yes gene_type:complete
MYQVKVIGESETDLRGAVPDSCKELTEKPGKDDKTLLYQVVKTQVELSLQKGDTVGALEAIEAYRKQHFNYASPLNVFRRDNQNGGNPFIGAHCFVGAFRDAAKYLYEIFYQKKGDKKPAQQHLRKFIQVRPYHIFFYTPDLNGEIVKAPSKVEGQQPTPAVQGFAEYETIFHPFQFQFSLIIYSKGPFEKFLKDKDKVLETLHQSAIHGIGGCRSAGYGGWKIVSAKVENGNKA